MRGWCRRHGLSGIRGAGAERGEETPIDPLAHRWADGRCDLRPSLCSCPVTRGPLLAVPRSNSLVRLPAQEWDENGSPLGRIAEPVRAVVRPRNNDFPHALLGARACSLATHVSPQFRRHQRAPYASVFLSSGPAMRGASTRIRIGVCRRVLVDCSRSVGVVINRRTAIVNVRSKSTAADLCPQIAIRRGDEFSRKPRLAVSPARCRRSRLQRRAQLHLISPSISPTRPGNVPSAERLEIKPVLSSSAPVKAPRRWPKSSYSINVGTSDERLTATTRWPNRRKVCVRGSTGRARQRRSRAPRALFAVPDSPTTMRPQISHNSMERSM